MNEISVIGYADIGSQTGQAFTELLNGLRDRDRLYKAYCRGVESHTLSDEFVKAPIPLNRTIPRLFTAINRFLSERFEHRYYSEQLFDTFAARHVDGQAPIHLHHTPGYLRSFTRGQELGKRVIVKATTEYSHHRFERLREEYATRDIADPITPAMEKLASKRADTLRESDGVIAISTFVKDSLVNAGVSSEDIGVAPLGINVDDYPTRSDIPEVFTVLFIGEITVDKGIPYLLDAWVHNGWGEDRAARLILAGDISSRMRGLISTYEIENLELPGYVDPRGYYPQTSIFCLPSLSEGFGKVILESMASGVPVLTTTNTGGPDVITDGEDGFIIQPGNTDELAWKLRTIRENPQRTFELGRNALESAQRNPWSKHVDRLLAHVDGVV